MIPKLRAAEQARHEEDLRNSRQDEDEREKEEDEGEDEEFNQHLSLFPELLIDSQVFATCFFFLYNFQVSFPI